MSVCVSFLQNLRISAYLGTCFELWVWWARLSSARVLRILRFKAYDTPQVGLSVGAFGGFQGRQYCW